MKKPKNIRIYDNDGQTFDRYTVVDLNQVERPSPDGTIYAALGLSRDPFNPLGFCQHCTAIPGKHLGRRVRFEALPDDVQQAIVQNL